MSFYRLFFITLLLSLAFIFYRELREELPNIEFKILLKMLIIRIFLAFHFAFWITSLTKTSVASSVMLVTSHPALVALLSRYFLKRKFLL
ncbi:MAG TPA: hypothetical protein ENI33_01690 [Thermoplasmatales archaeon]|nr:hypothetical protein [Thermoplasmatales archaeon]